MERERIVGALEELAALSELLGENPFKVRAYANAARTLSKASQPVESWGEPGVLEALPGVGKAIAEKVREEIATGSVHKLEELRAKVPPGVRELLGVPGLGPKKAGVLWRQLGLQSAGELEYACLENRLVSLPGFGPKTQAKVLEGVRSLARRRGKLLLPSALAAQAALAARVE
ncbi:MAG: helix-hairpin-helix domain-containing protein, partial [Acidobacteriota bacterium]